MLCGICDGVFCVRLDATFLYSVPFAEFFSTFVLDAWILPLFCRPYNCCLYNGNVSTSFEVPLLLDVKHEAFFFFHSDDVRKGDNYECSATPIVSSDRTQQ